MFFRVPSTADARPRAHPSVILWSLERGIDADREIEIREFAPVAVFEDQRRAAIFPYDARIVAYENHRRVTPVAEQRVVALLMEALIAHRDDLIDQETIEIDRESQREGQPGAHARGIIFHR